MTTYPRLTADIPADHVKLLYWVRTEHDARDCAGSTGSLIRPAKGCVNAALELDRHGDRDLHVVGGHGVTIMWPSGRSRNVRADN